jgi:hypothetical protein
LRHFSNFSQNELFYLCRFHSDMATCRPTLFLLTVKEILLVHFISRVQMKSWAGKALITANCWAFLKRRLIGAC